MHLLGLTSTQESLWWVTLGLGLIVLLAVAAFLTLFISLVGTIENGRCHSRDARSSGGEHFRYSTDCQDG